MPIAGVGRVEPMDPVVKREVMRRARESGTFATEPDAAWVGSPLPASVNRRVVSRDATKRPAGPDAPLTSSSHFGATVAPRTLDYDGSSGRGSFSGAAVHPTPSDDAPLVSPDRVEAFRGMSPTPESPAGFGAGRLPWGSIDLTERVPTPTTEYVDTDDDDDVTPRSPGGGPLTLRRARELQADKERAHAAAAAALGAGPPLPSSSRGDDTARVHVSNTTSAGRPVSREASSGFHPDSFAGSRPQSREWSGGGGGGGPGRRVTAAEISGAMRGVRAPKGSAAWESSPSPPTDLVRQQPRVGVGKNDEVHREPAVDSSEEFERETDALLSRGAALMEEPAGGAEKGAEEGADTTVHESKPTSPASPERRATPPPAITSDTSPSAASSEDENREPGVDDETGPLVKPIPSPGIPGIPTEIPTVTELDAQGESLEVPRRASMPPPRRGWIDETEDGADDLELAAAVHSVPPPSVAPLPSPASPAKTSPAPPPPAVVRPGSAASSRSDFVSKLPAPPLGLLSKSGAKQTTPTNPRSRLKTFDYSKQNGRSPTVISEDKDAADAAADKAALTNAVRPMSQGARVRSTTAAGYKKNAPPENTQKNTKQPDPAETSVATKGKKVTYRDRIASGRRAASGGGGGADTAPAATDTNDEGPVPSVTPAKLKQREDGTDATSERVLTKAEEAKNRLRRNRRSSATSASMGAPLGLGPRASDGGAASSVSASVPAHPVNDAAQALAKPAPKVGLSASELADRLGSVKRVIKPRSSMPDLGRGGGRGPGVSDKHAPGEDKQRSADAETSGSVPTSVPDATSTESGVPIVRGLDEAELVLRVATLANKDALVGARGAVVRMTELLDYVNSTSKALNCEPQNVFGHLLFRCGQPTDRTSQSLRLNDVVDPDVLRRMVSVTAELRGLLRIKVQDNTDLQLAATALRETASFFARLDDAAEKCSMEPWKVLEAQRPSRGQATRGW
jgi:hypothetical protein